MKKLLLLLALLVLPKIVVASSVGIGVSPSVVELELTSLHPVEVIKFKLWNEGDTTVNFTIIPKENMADFSDFAGKTITVHANTTLSNSTEIEIPFIKKTYGDKKVQTGFYVRAKLPVNATVGVIPQVFVKINITQRELGSRGEVIKAYEENFKKLKEKNETYKKYENFTNFTWWSNLMNKTVIRQEEAGEAKETEKETDTLPILLIIIPAGVLCTGFAVFILINLVKSYFEGH